MLVQNGYLVEGGFIPSMIVPHGAALLILLFILQKESETEMG